MPVAVQYQQDILARNINRCNQYNHMCARNKFAQITSNVKAWHTECVRKLVLTGKFVMVKVFLWDTSNIVSHTSRIVCYIESTMP